MFVSLTSSYCYFYFSLSLLSFFFNDTATTEIYTLSLHDALPIFFAAGAETIECEVCDQYTIQGDLFIDRDRKSTRLNSSHANISYAVFCLKKKKKNKKYN